MFQGSGPASSNQTSALGMNSLQVGPMGSPTMNRMETGEERGLAERERQGRDRGVAGNSGAAMQANAQGAAVTQATTPAQSLVGQAGSSVGNAQHILPQQAFGSY